MSLCGGHYEGLKKIFEAWSLPFNMVGPTLHTTRARIFTLEIGLEPDRTPIRFAAE